MEFPRQEYWSGVPLPSPIEGLPYPPPEDLPNLGIECRSSTLQVDSLSSEPPGKPKNTVVGCHALLQEIFPIQGLNPDLLQLQADSLLTEPPGKPKTEEGNPAGLSSCSGGLRPLVVAGSHHHLPGP